MAHAIHTPSTDTALFILAVICIAALPGCVTVLSDHYTYREVGTVRGGTLKLDGYYAYEEEGADRKTLWPILLWQDGTAALFEGYSFTHEYEASHFPGMGAFEAAHRDFKKDLSGITGEQINRKGPFVSWGGFRVEDDSISVQVMKCFNSTGGTTCKPFEYRGHIVNDSTFTFESGVDLERLHRFGQGRFGEKGTYRFYPLSEFEKPDSANWTQTHPDLQ